jgi:hypothetical protein
MRAQAMPGEDPATLPPPDAVAPHILRMLAPEYQGNGELFDVLSGTTRALRAE